VSTCHPYATHCQTTSHRFEICRRFNPRTISTLAAPVIKRNVETQHAASLRVGYMPGRLRASIALPGFDYQMSSLKRPQRNGDENKNEKDQAENREPLPLGIERRDLIPRAGIGAPHQEN